MRRRWGVRDTDSGLSCFHQKDRNVSPFLFFVRFNSFSFDSTETETIIHEDKGFATVAYWRIKSARLQAKAYMGDVSLSPSLPPLLDETAKQIYDAAMAIGTPIEDNRITPRTNHATPTSAFSTSSIRHGNWIAVGNVFSNCERTLTVEEETELSFKNLKGDIYRNNG